MANWRVFELTMTVHMLDRGQEIPETFEEWLRIAFGDKAVDTMGASSTTLESVVEIRYPLADDIVERRRRLVKAISPRYS